MNPFHSLLIPLKVCVNPNGGLTNPMGGLIGDLSGAVVGLFSPLAIVLTLIVGLLALLTVFTNKGREFLAKIPMPFGIAIGTVLVLAVGSAFWSIVLHASC
ncbi:MAG: hypothetical protein ABIP74_03435 [Candidatus Saccharimonas sp.]